MNSDDRQPTSIKLVGQNTAEAGIFFRMREWVDVLPWIRLARTLRAVGSPPLVLFVAITFLVWRTGEAQIITHSPMESSGWIDANFGSMQMEATTLAIFLHQTNSTSIYDLGDGTVWWRVALLVVWAVFVWAPVAILLARQGGSLTAGRAMVGFRTGISLAIRRSPAAWLSSLVPLGCVFAIALMIVLLGLLSRLAVGVLWIEIVFALCTALVAIPCGILAFGANVAIPLSWAALANERQPDTLDSLSRGYEYLFRRPLQLVLYLLVALAILWVVKLVALGIALAAISVTTQTLEFCGTPPTTIEFSTRFLSHVPAIALITSLWSLIGGIYLLLRYDTGGQEVEDLWQPTPRPDSPLPEIPS